MREYRMRSTLWVVMEFCEAGSTLEATRTSRAPWSAFARCASSPTQPCSGDAQDGPRL